MYRIRCAEVWGGTGGRDEDVCSGGVVASLHSSASGGGNGGDIYYLSVCEKDSLTRVAVADVAGHGASVSDVSQWLYSILETHMNDTDGDRILGELNRSAVDHGFRAMTTAAVVGFYSHDSNLYFSYAGHAPLLLCRAGTAAWLPVELDEAATRCANVPLGVIPDACFDQQRLALVPGDRIFLHTDGVTEAMDAGGELFGTDRLRQALTRARGGSLAALKRSVLDAVAQHTGGVEPHDDVTLLVVEIR